MRIIKKRILSSSIFLMVLSFFAVTSGIVNAETQYVSDQLVITLREGKGNEYKIMKMLTTGTALEIIEESENHLRVRTQDGQEGWVLKQYITSETPKTEVIGRLEKEIDQMKTRLQQYKKEKDSVQDQLKTTISDYRDKITDLTQKISAGKEETEQKSRELEKVTKKYNTLVDQSKDVVELANERDRLTTQNEKLSAETGVLKRENSRLKRFQILWWFLAGGGVFFVGWITGRISRKKRYYY